MAEREVVGVPPAAVVIGVPVVEIPKAGRSSN